MTEVGRGVFDQNSSPKERLSIDISDSVESVDDDPCNFLSLLVSR